MDFIAGDELDDERHIEQQVVLNIRNFILQMGKGFCFIGNQYRIEVDGDDFFIYLLFFNRHLQCLVAFDLLCCAQHNSSYVANSVMCC